MVYSALFAVRRTSEIKCNHRSQSAILFGEKLSFLFAFNKIKIDNPVFVLDHSKPWTSDDARPEKDSDKFELQTLNYDHIKQQRN